MGEKKLIKAINQRLKQRILDYMQNSIESVSIVAQKFDISPQYLYKFMKDDLEFKAALELQNDLKVDYVEGKMFENIDVNDSSMIQFYLKHKGKHRGYTDKLQIDHTTNGESLNKIEVEIVHKVVSSDKPNELT